MKKLIALLLALVTVFSFASCVKGAAKDADEKVFKTKDFSITLTEAFKQNRTNAYAGHFEAADAEVFIIKEARADFPEEKQNMPLYDQKGIQEYYAELVWRNHLKMEGLTAPTYDDKNGLICLEFTEMKDTGVSEKVFCSMYQNNDAYWTAQFRCAEADYETYKPLFIKWAQSIVLNDAMQLYRIPTTNIQMELPLGFEVALETQKDISQNPYDLTCRYKYNEAYSITATPDYHYISIRKEAAEIYEDYVNEAHSKINNYAGTSVNTPSDVVMGNDVSYFTYTSFDDSYGYVEAFYQYEYDFYRICFKCKGSDFAKYEASFIEWAKSVTFVEDAPEA